MKTTTTEEQSKTRWPATAVLRYSQTVIDAAKKLTPGTVDEQSQLIGMHNAEPLLVALDAMLKYATEYRVRYEAPLAIPSPEPIGGPRCYRIIDALRRIAKGIPAEYRYKVVAA